MTTQKARENSKSFPYFRNKNFELILVHLFQWICSSAGSALLWPSVPPNCSRNTSSVPPSHLPVETVIDSFHLALFLPGLLLKLIFACVDVLIIRQTVNHTANHNKNYTANHNKSLITEWEPAILSHNSFLIFGGMELTWIDAFL